MAEDKKIKSRTYIPRVYYKGELLSFKETPLTIKATELCPYCKEEFTIEQIKHIEPNANETLAKKIIEYLNLYRKDYKLDTCLRKAHFISQIAAEMEFKSTSMKEGHNYKFSSLSAKYFNRNQIIDNIILSSLEKQLSKIFEIKNKDDKVISKSNAELKTLLVNNSVTADIRKLYGKYSGKRIILKEVKEKIKDKKGGEVEVLKFKIMLKKHKAFRKPLFSRFYGDRLENDNELSRDGFMFCGKGIKQLTGRTNYKKFSNYRKKHPFPDDPKGYVDFTEVTDKKDFKGEFDLLADTNNVIYGVQSALWYYIKGNPYKSKYTVDWADEDNIKLTSYTINGGYNGIRNRRDNTLKAKEDKGFKVYKHYEEIHKNGNKNDKKRIENQLLNISKEEKVKIKEYDSKKKKMVTTYIDLKDKEAEKLLKKLKKVKPINYIKSKGINLQINSDLKLIPRITNNE